MEFRSITSDEVEPFLRSLYTAFGDAHADPDELIADRALTEPDRTFAAFDDGEIVGCAAALTHRMVVPGGAFVPTAGVTMVGVLPTHRRRGILRELMVRLLAQAEDRNEPLASLFASQAAIYGRFGFGHAAWHLTFDVALDRIEWVPDLEPVGRVRLVSRDEALPSMRAVYERTLPQRPGGIELPGATFDHTLRESVKNDEKVFYALHDDGDGTVDAFAMYRVKHEWPRGLPSSELKVRHFVAASPSAGWSLWRYLFDVDLTSRAKAASRPIDDALLLQVLEPRALRPELDDGLFLRPIDLGVALEARRYAADGSVSLAVTDPFPSAGERVLRLTVAEGSAEVTPHEGEPDLICSIQAIGSTYLGGATWSALAKAGLVRVRSSAALDTIDAMFRVDVAPWPIVYF